MVDQAPTPPPARVAFVHRNAIWSVDARGNDRVRLIAHADSVAFSPDGQRLAYGSGQSIGVAAADGTGARIVVRHERGGSVGHVEWSPDSRRIAFTRFRQGRHGQRVTIATARPDGADDRTVLRTKRNLFTSAWTANGRGLYLSHFRRRGATVDRIDLATGRRIVVVPGAYAARPSPDGTRLAFATIRSTKGASCDSDSDECFPHADIAVSDTGGHGRRTLLRTRAFEDEPSWSPDGTRLVFASTRNVSGAQSFASEVYSVTAAGECLTWLTNGDFPSDRPVWTSFPGDADPGACGDAGRAPLVEGHVRPGRLGTVPWPGAAFEHALLSDVTRELGSVELRYDDCETFTPAECSAPFQLYVERPCADRFTLGQLDELRGLRRDGSTLIGHDPGGTYVYVGSFEVFISAGRPVADRLAGALAPADGSAFPPQPSLPASERRKLPSDLRGFVKTC